MALVVGAWLAVAAAGASAVVAQPGEPGTGSTPSADELTELSAEALRERITNQLEQVAAVRARVEEFGRRVTELAQAANELAASRTAFELPEAADPQPQREPEAARATLDAWGARLQALERLRKLVADLAAAETRHREALLLAANEARVMAETLQPLVPLVTEAQRRVEAGDLSADQLPEWARDNNPAERADEWRTRAAERRTAATRAEAAIREATVAGQQFDAQLEAARAAQQQAAAWLQEATRRADLRNELAANDLASLVALLSTRLEELRAAHIKLAEEASAIAERRAEVKTLEDELAARTPPDPSSIQVDGDEDVESLREARRALAVAQTTAAFHVDTLAKLQALRTKTTALLESVTQAATSATEVLERALEVDVMARLVQQRLDAGEGDGISVPEGATPDATATLLREVRERHATLTEAAVALGARAGQLATRVETASRAVEDSRATATARQQAVEREARWATFIREVQTLESPALIERFRTTLTALAERTKRIKQLDADRQAAVAEVDAANKVLATDADPVVLAEIGNRPRFVEWARSKGFEIPEEFNPPAEGGSESGNGAAGGASGPAGNGGRGAATSSGQALPTPGAEPPPAEITERRIRSTLEVRDQTVARRLGYFRDRAKQRVRLVAAVQARIAAATAHRDAVREAVELARRAWACATTLEVRVARGDVTGADIPADQVETWRRREAVSALQQTVDELTRQIETSTARLESLQASNPAEPFIAPLESRHQNLTRQIEKLRERQELEVAYPTPEPGSLSELEQKKKEHEVEQRMSADTGTWEQLVGVFGGDAADDIDELLREYYQRLLEFERQGDNLDRRAGITESIETLVAGTREILEQLDEHVEARRAAAEHELEVAAVRVRAVLKPDADTLARASELGIDTATLEQLPPATDEAAHRAARVKLLNSLVGPWARLTGYTQWHKEIRAAVGELGGIDADIGRLKDLVAALRAAHQDHQRRIQRLTGYPDSALQELPAEERPTGVERDRFRLGEIGLLRRERIRALNWAAGGNAIWLVLIPFFAWLAIRGAGLIGNRLIARVSTEPVDGAPPSDQKSAREREERARTLFHVFKAGWTIVVVILAAIYMLKAISVDVTPLLASAGIFGLAIAFGAQPLMRDFFAGFFILLENQYNLHDVVTINGITGTIERITLRLTIVRDIEGKVHYIPNGQIDLVTNQTKNWARIKLDIGASYSDHPDAVTDCLKALGEELKTDPVLGREVLEFEVPGLETFADSSINYRVHIKVVAGSQWKIAREFRRRVKLAFDKEGIEIPFPQRVVHHVRDDSGDADS